MANIGTYSNDSTIDPADKLIGTDGTSGADSGKTKNYTISSLTTHIANNLGYTVYTALLTQAGTAAPVATILQNTTGGTFTWSRQSAANYTVTASSALFTANKTIVFLNNGSIEPSNVKWNRTSDTTITLIGIADNQFTNGSFEIRIYS